MKHIFWFLTCVLIAIGMYREGFKQGDLERRLQDGEIMSRQVEQEMMRHYREENYWQDRTEECLAKK